MLSETAVSNLIKLEASRKNMRLWRNNTGAMRTDTGSYVRFGLCNESKAVNDVLKSGDLIGIMPVIITPEMIGCVIGQFVSREIKREGWKYTGKEREPAQLAWIKLIRSLGGNAAFATKEGTL